MTDRFETLAVHAGAEPDAQTGAVVPAIQMSATFKQDGVGGLRGGFEYGRSGNPTRIALEQAIATLEGATHGLAYASGLAATQNVLYLLEPGDRLLMSDDVYGGTWRLADKVWRRYGIETDTLDLRDLDAVAAAFAGERPPRMVWIETPSNPLLKVIDISASRGSRRSRARSRSSTTRSPRRTSSARSTSAPTWSCTRPPSTSAATRT